MKIMFGTYPQNVKMRYVEHCFLLVLGRGMEVREGRPPFAARDRGAFSSYGRVVEVMY
jgi:hypothetical protein